MVLLKAQSLLDPLEVLHSLYNHNTQAHPNRLYKLFLFLKFKRMYYVKHVWLFSLCYEFSHCNQGINVVHMTNKILS